MGYIIHQYVFSFAFYLNLLRSNESLSFNLDINNRTFSSLRRCIYILCINLIWRYNVIFFFISACPYLSSACCGYSSRSRMTFYFSFDWNIVLESSSVFRTGNSRWHIGITLRLSHFYCFLTFSSNSGHHLSWKFAILSQMMVQSSPSMELVSYLLISMFYCFFLFCFSCWRLRHLCLSCGFRLFNVCFL